MVIFDYEGRTTTAGGALARKTKGSEYKGIPVLDSEGLPVFVFAVVMFLYSVWENHGVFDFRSKFYCFKTANQKNRIN